MTLKVKKKDKTFSLLIKPASADCNLDCTYCFYLEKSRLYSKKARHRMSDAVLERLVQSYMQTEQPVYSFGWQGGEPTLMGLPFFERVVALQQKHGRPGASVANGLQTNATLIDRPFAEHLAKYRFLIGCSLDGDEGIHDKYRTSRTGQLSHTRVQKGIHALKAAGAEFNILVLVSQANIRKAKEVYRYLVEAGHLYHQYIPCVEFDDDGQLQPFSISGEEWGDFLCELFDLWYQNDTRRVSIRHFDSILAKIVDGAETVCTLGRNCCQYFVVEHNGDVYPCDFFVEPGLCLGNIMSSSWDELLNHPKYLDFGRQKSCWNTLCDECDCLDLCSGDCLKHRLYYGNRPQNISHLCDGWKKFIHYTRDRFATLARTVVEERKTADHVRGTIPDTPEVSVKTGRNAPCPCGSGLKFKKCCGKRV